MDKNLNEKINRNSGESWIRPDLLTLPPEASDPAIALKLSIKKINMFYSSIRKCVLFRLNGKTKGVSDKEIDDVEDSIAIVADIHESLEYFFNYWSNKFCSYEIDNKGEIIKLTEQILTFLVQIHNMATNEIIQNIDLGNFINARNKIRHMDELVKLMIKDVKIFFTHYRAEPPTKSKLKESVTQAVLDILNEGL